MVQRARGAALLALLVSTATASPSIDVGMVASFAAPPYLTELLETAAQENASSYFPLLDRIADGHFAGLATDRALHDAFVALLEDDGHVSSDGRATFELALALRAAAPRVEAHFQYYQTAARPDGDAGDAGDACEPWVLWDGARHCTASLSADDPVPVANHADQATTLPFDRVLGHGPAAVLYADIASPAFGAMHKTLAAKARRNELSYRVRHMQEKRRNGPLPVSGYGVELALKRTDYIVMDDRDTGETEPAEVVLDAETEVADLAALSKSQLAGLGFSTADYIVQSTDPLDTLVAVTQDFPKYARSLAAHNASPAFVREHVANRQLMVPAGTSVLWINGVQLAERQVQPLALLETIRRERAMMEGVRALGLTARQATDLFGHPAVAQAKSQATPTRYDWRDEAEGGGVLVWLNDVARDSAYADMPTSLTALLQGGMPGQIPPMARDVFNQVYPVDLGRAADVHLVVDTLVEFVRRRIPIRFGLVPLTTTDASAQHARVVYYLAEHHGTAAVVAYLTRVLRDGLLAGPTAKSFAQLAKKYARSDGATTPTLDDVLADDLLADRLAQAQRWADRLGVDLNESPVLVDGIIVPRDANWLQAMSAEVMQSLRALQHAVYYKRIDDDAWAPGFFLDGALARRSPIVVPADPTAVRFLNVHRLYTDHADLFRALPTIDAEADADATTWALLTVVADLSTEPGLRLLAAALQHRADNSGVRLDIIDNPADPDHAVDMAAALLRADPENLVHAGSWQALQARLATEPAGPAEPATPVYLAALARFLTTASLEPGASALLFNGRVVGPLAPGTALAADDMAALHQYERGTRIVPVLEALDDLGMADRIASPLAAAQLTSVVALSTVSDVPEGIFETASTLRTAAFHLWNASHTAFAVGDADTATVHLHVALDPASETGQRWAPLLRVLARLDGVYLRVFLNPRDRLLDLPVKRFYRAVLAEAPAFDDAGAVAAPSASFDNLPSEALLSLKMDVPPAWLVAPKVSLHDLDNIKLAAVKGGVTAVTATYELKHILIEGHSTEASGAPPRGAQLILGTARDAHYADTLVMANLGYFQFKANPGAYHIRLMDGRSNDIFTMQSIGAHGRPSGPDDAGTTVVLMDFQGATLYPLLGRKPGMEHAEILADDAAAADADTNYVAKGLKMAEDLLGRAMPRSKPTEVANVRHADINIFSVASGHLYERMLNIMMVSVMQHTQHTVKFWFIEQFLSPSFKDFIPTLAAAYGFDYEMVTYKWPHWLRQQKEKQREIWGYKILFLDVLFPLSLDKVIFVDADQVVRTDMYDLVKLDLEGAPYGFTPMCDSRVEMEGFRFWKQGYWSNYLRGLPYHISALYVVDLRRFRQLAAGDRLRQTYHALSADPNSLSNLDQDLPNHMQFQIPIHSLPQDWLWCETWCSDDALATAKTIDLCNNPETKEPKLDRARRQVPEWSVYDDQIAALDTARRARDARDAAKPVVPIRVAGGSAQKVVGGQAEIIEVETHDRDEL